MEHRFVTDWTFTGP